MVSQHGRWCRIGPTLIYTFFFVFLFFEASIVNQKRVRCKMCWSEQRNECVCVLQKGVRGHYFKRTKSHFKYQLFFFSLRGSFIVFETWHPIKIVGQKFFHARTMKTAKKNDSVPMICAVFSPLSFHCRFFSAENL